MGDAMSGSEGRRGEGVERLASVGRSRNVTAHHAHLGNDVLAHIFDRHQPVRPEIVVPHVAPPPADPTTQPQTFRVYERCPRPWKYKLWDFSDLEGKA